MTAGNAKLPLELVYTLAMTVRSGRSSCTTVPICGTPAESRTKPDTDAEVAPWSGAVPTVISTANNAKWSLRIITDFGDLAASLANLISKHLPRVQIGRAHV